METTKSQDGTTIAYDRYGSGPALILVSGALGTKAAGGPLADRLKDSFTVYAYDRRGRVDSGDTQPYAPQREIEDIEAIIDVAGGKAYVYGMSSGAVLSLHAANALGAKVEKVIMYEPPVIVDDSHPPLPDDYVEHLDALLKENKRSEAVEYFMTAAVGVPADFLAGMKQDPMWQSMEAVANTIPYDGQVMGTLMSGKDVPENRWPNVDIPVLIIVGGNSEPFFSAGAQAVVDTIGRNATVTILPGQDHNVDPAVVAPLVIEFLEKDRVSQ